MGRDARMQHDRDFESDEEYIRDNTHSCSSLSTDCIYVLLSKSRVHVDTRVRVSARTNATVWDTLTRS